MKKITMSAVALTAILGSMSSLSAADAQSGINILNDIKLKGEIRPRYEYADVDKSSTTSANAFTNRLHLAATAGLLGVDGLTTTLGVQTVNNFGWNDYNLPHGTNANSSGLTYDVINDPNAAMLSEATLDYKIGKTALHTGRSQINLDNQRFIGTVGWRQLERSYDTVYVANNSVKNLNLLAAYVYGFAGVGSVTTIDTKSILLHAKYKVADALTITAYDYMLAVGAQGIDSDTIGLALTGKIDAGAKLTYRAEYAIQKDATMKYHDIDTKADATYYNLDLGANISGVLAGVNYEVLSGTNGTDGNTAFNPKLGTNHKFNGWADVFYVANVPTMGLQDANARLGYKAKGFGKFLAVYHSFTAQTTTGTASDDLGSEIDAVYVNKIPGVNNLKGLLKLASFSKGNATNGYAASQSDKTVGWVQLDYKF